jgi:hypothetical protein
MVSRPHLKQAQRGLVGSEADGLKKCRQFLVSGH